MNLSRQFEGCTSSIFTVIPTSLCKAACFGIPTESTSLLQKPASAPSVEMCVSRLMRRRREATRALVRMFPSSPIDLKCLDFTRCMANLLVDIITAYLPCGQQLQFVLSIEFYLGSQLFADHYTGSASPRLPLERRRPCAGLFARSFIYAYSNPNTGAVHLGC